MSWGSTGSATAAYVFGVGGCTVRSCRHPTHVHGANPARMRSGTYCLDLTRGVTQSTLDGCTGWGSSGGGFTHSYDGRLSPTEGCGESGRATAGGREFTTGSGNNNAPDTTRRWQTQQEEHFSRRRA